MTYDQALKDFRPVAHLTYFEYREHTTIEDLCYLCLHELDLHADGEYWHPAQVRKALLKFCQKWGPHTNNPGLDYAEEARKQYALGSSKKKSDCISIY